MSDVSSVTLGSTPSGGLPRLAPESRPGTGGSAYARVKALVEWPVALLLLLGCVPLFAVMAVLLKASSKGPIAYSQVRLGRHGKQFRIHKFRTMTHECEATTGPVWSVAGDSRVTSVGRWLRDTHLDELPQLWNVLRGEMSLVGPRPERPEIAEQIERWLPEFRERLEVRPGIAGLAQVCLPPDADLHTVRRKLAYDRRYIANLGLWLDLRVLFATVLHFGGLAATAIARMILRHGTHAPLAEPRGIAAALGLSMLDAGGAPVANAPSDLSKVA